MVKRRSGKNDRFVVIDHGLAIYMQLNSPRKHDLLEVPAFGYEVFHSMGMGYCGHILGNNWACVEYFCHVMAGGTNDLYAPLKGGMVWFSAGKGREEGVVNVNNPIRVHINNPGCYDLHVACQYNKINLMFSK